jgi:hypothetical protein
MFLLGFEGQSAIRFSLFLPGVRKFLAGFLFGEYGEDSIYRSNLVILDDLEWPGWDSRREPYWRASGSDYSIDRPQEYTY